MADELRQLVREDENGRPAHAAAAGPACGVGSPVLTNT
jgi:hypothetical protein